MIGKPIVGKSFGGCVRYVVDRKEAHIIATEGVRMQSSETLIQDFNLQRKMRPELGKATGHIVLSWASEDGAKLTDAIMAERAKEYMDMMAIRNTQYVIVRHTDREHPHLHVIYNRVDNTGNTITDRNSYARNIKACKAITLKYDYHLGRDKSRVNRKALRGKEKMRHELYDVIHSASKRATSWKELEVKLNIQGIQIACKYKSGTEEVQGISFEKGKLKIKGSAIDRSFSYAHLDRRLRMNRRLLQYKAARNIIKPSLNRQVKENSTQHVRNDQYKMPSTNQGLLETLLSPNMEEGMTGATHDSALDRRKRKKRRGQERGMRR